MSNSRGDAVKEVAGATGAPLSIRLAAEEGGDDTALVADGRSWTWTGLADEVRRERSLLEEAGASDGRVVLDAHPTPTTVIRLLALFDAGLCAAPLPPGLPAPIRAGRVRALAPCVDRETGARHGSDAADAVTWTARPGLPPRRPLAVLFTSGSSGIPRAVELSAAAFLASASASAGHLGWRPDDRWLCCLPLAHVGGLSVVTRCLLARRTIVLTAGFDAPAVARTLEDDGVTLASFVPTMLLRLFEADETWRAPNSLRAALLGGAPAPEGLWREIERRGFPALATYGMTETCSQIATGCPAAPRALVPLHGVSVRVREGRIEVAGPMLADRVGAGGREEVFTVDGYLRTGDLGKVEAGVLTVAGRADDTIVTGGKNVAPAEVEAILERHPAIRRAVVFGVPDETWGELVAAALEPEEGADAPNAAGALRDWLAARLPSHQRPRRVAWLSTLPVTPTGKVDRSAAAAIGRERAADL